jgi:hypothetical protein
MTFYAPASLLIRSSGAPDDARAKIRRNRSRKAASRELGDTFSVLNSVGNADAPQRNRIISIWLTKRKRRLAAQTNDRCTPQSMIRLTRRDIGKLWVQ